VKAKIVYMILAFVLVFSLAAVVMPASPVMAADTWYVDDDNCPGGTGTAGDPFCKIQDAINAANSGDTIIVAAGTYSPSTNGETVPIVINKSVTLKGSQADVDPRPSSGGRSGAESVIDAQ
jgi:pectin methylesterase-like acyl-CoA thioesterase